MRDVEGCLASPLLAPRLQQPWESIAGRVNLEEVALAAAADTTARIRAARQSNGLVSGSTTATPSSERHFSTPRRELLESKRNHSATHGTHRSPHAPWALVPLTPMVPALHGWPCFPLDGLEKRSPETESWRELSELKSRLRELQDSCSSLEEENAELKKDWANGGPRKFEENCRRYEQDIIHLKRALKEREEGEKALRRMFAEAQALNRKVLSENEHLKQELEILKFGAVKSRSETRRSSQESRSMIEVDLTGDLP